MFLFLWVHVCKFSSWCFLYQEPLIKLHSAVSCHFFRHLTLLFIYWLIAQWHRVSGDYANFISSICHFVIAWLFLIIGASGCHRAAPAAAAADTNSLLAFIPHFLAHTASSICQCQVTMLINRSVLAALEMWSCAVEARGSLCHLCCLWRVVFFFSHWAPVIVSAT